MKIHFLQHVPFEGLAHIESWAIKHQHALSATRFYANDPLPHVDEMDWLLVMGGPMNVYEDAKYPWLLEEKHLIEQAIEQHKTVIGICRGAQLIADVLGANVYPGQHKEIGWFPLEMTSQAKDSTMFSSLPQKFTVFYWHGDTFDLPQGAVRLAYSEGCYNQAFVYSNNVLGLQFHLESTKGSVRQIIENCAAELVNGKYIQTPEVMLSQDDCFAAIHTAMSHILNHLEKQSTNQFATS